MNECQEYIKEALSEVNGENDFKNAVVHCLEFMAQKIDNPSYVYPPVLRGDKEDTQTG